jgi:hypothetical protein
MDPVVNYSNLAELVISFDILVGHKGNIFFFSNTPYRKHASLDSDESHLIYTVKLIIAMEC